MPELYVIALFNEDGTIKEFDRKGRNNAISGYDNIASAKRGLGQTKRHAYDFQKPFYKVVKANRLEVVEV